MEKDERLKKAKRSFLLPQSIIDALQTLADKDPDRPGNLQYQLLLYLRDNKGPFSKDAEYFINHDESWKHSAKKAEFRYPSRVKRKRPAPRKKQAGDG